MLSIGTPGRLLAEGLIDRVRAADSDASLKLTHPLHGDGTLRDVPSEALEKREDHVIGEALKTGGVAIVVFGGGLTTSKTTSSDCLTAGPD